jgi:hypothetical protein
MPRLSRRFALTLLFSVSLALVAQAVQARELSPVGWFDAVAHQVAQWTAGWWTLPTLRATAGPAKSYSAKSARPPITVDCGAAIAPDGHCLSLAPIRH